MSTTTEKPNPAPVKGDIFLNGRCVHFGDVPAAMPSVDYYAQGINKLRATANCPVLSPEETLLAQELADINLNIPTKPLPVPPVRSRRVMTDEYLNGEIQQRPSVAEVVAEQSRQIESERRGEFERFTHNELRDLKKEVSSLTFKQLMTNWIFAAAVLIAILVALA